MVDHTITEGSEVGIKILLSLASTTEPPFLSLNSALEKAAEKASCRVTFEEGRKIKPGKNCEIKNCTKAVFYPLNRCAVQNQDSMRKLERIAAQFTELDWILIRSVVGVQVIKIITEEAGGEILTLNHRERRKKKVS